MYARLLGVLGMVCRSARFGFPWEAGRIVGREWNATYQCIPPVRLEGHELGQFSGSKNLVKNAGVETNVNIALVKILLAAVGYGSH